MTDKLMPPDVFKTFFSQVLTSDPFRKRIARDPFGVLEDFGYDVNIPPVIRAKLNKMIVLETNRARPHCEVCSICALCVLCAEVDAGVAAGSVSSVLALWPAEVYAAQPCASPPAAGSEGENAAAKIGADVDEDPLYL